MSESRITDIVARLDVLPVSRSAAGVCSIDGPCLEIIETEERFCEKLALLDQHFVKRLRAEIEINSFKVTQIDTDTVDKWFSIIPALLEQHRSLLKFLNAGGIIGLGLRFKHFFKSTKQLYGDYASQFQGVSDDIRQARDENAWLNTFIRVSERVTKDSLLSLRISPIQRIPRYTIMLTAVLNSLSVDRASERKSVQEAIKYVEQTCQHIDKSASLNEHSHLQVRRIEQDMFQGRIRLRNVKNRRFIYQGTLDKMYAQSARHVNRMKTYTFLLFSDCLIYADLDAPIDKRLKHVLDLSQMRIIDVLDGQIPSVVNAFRVLSRTKVIVVSATSANEKRFWINILLDQIDAAVTAAGSRAESPYNNLEKTIKLEQYRPSMTWPTKFSSLTMATFSQ